MIINLEKKLSFNVLKNKNTKYKTVKYIVWKYNWTYDLNYLKFINKVYY